MWEQEGWEKSIQGGEEKALELQSHKPRKEVTLLSLSLLKSIIVLQFRWSPFGKDSRPHRLENLRDSKNNNKGVPFLFGPWTTVRGTATLVVVVVVVDVVTVDTPIYDLLWVEALEQKLFIRIEMKQNEYYIKVLSIYWLTYNLSSFKFLSFSW